MHVTNKQQPASKQDFINKLAKHACYKQAAQQPASKQDYINKLAKHACYKQHSSPQARLHQ
jgi:hypothetical protein